jgi:prepilin-type N-terminal cleavage/methylation domain-containing protein
MTHRRSPPRPGYTLIEMLAVISLLSAVFLMVAQLLFGLMQAEQASTRDAVFDRRLADLALQWRSDLYAAAAVTMDDGGQRLDCIAPGGQSVRYVVAEDAIVRTAEGPPAHRELYRLPGTQPAFRRGGDEARTLELVIDRSLPQLTYTPTADVRAGQLVLRATLRPPAAATDRKD